MHERPEGLLLAVAANTGTLETWFMLVNPGGTEEWRKPLAPCGVAGTGLSSVAVGPEHLWGVATVAVGPNQSVGLIAEIGFDGELQATHTLANAPEGTVMVESIATNGEVIAISGYSYMPNYVYTAFVARIQ
jgi:hypothetical protein